MVKTIKSRKLREDDGVVEVDGVKLDAATAEVVFADKEKDIQVVVSNDPENEDIAVVAVLTNSEEEVEDEKVLGSASVEGEGEDAEEARKKARREAFRKRLEARRANKADGNKTDESKKAAERRDAFRKRLEARRAARKQESARKDAIAEARAKFKSKLGKKA